MQALEFCLQMLIVMGVGVLVGKIGIADEGFTRRFSALLVNVLIPCMAFTVMIEQFSMEELSMGLAMMACCIAVLLVGLFLAILVRAIRRKKDDTAGVIIPCVMFMNANFVGFPVIQALYGDAALVYANFFMLPYRLVFYTVMPMLFNGNGKESGRCALKGILKSCNNPGIYAALIGLAITLLKIPVPSVILSVTKMLGNAAMPLGMMVCGMFVSGIRFKDAFMSGGCILTVVCRNILVPALVWLLMLFLGVDGILLRLSVIFAALPIPSLAAPFAMQYGRNSGLAASMVFASTAACIVTIPLWGALLNAFG